MSSNYLNNTSAVSEFCTKVRDTGLPEYKGTDLGRDSIVSYCIENDLSMVSEKYPSTLVTPGYKEYMDSLKIDNKSPEDYEEYHNNKFVVAFSSVLEKLGYNSINVYYECFEEEPRARCYEIELKGLPRFLENSEVPVYFLDDTLFFSPDFKYGLCIFHHEVIEFFSFGGEVSELYKQTAGEICT